MLVLSRKFGERVVIRRSPGEPEGEIVLMILRRNRDGSIRLGFEAPADVRILREELLERR